MDNQEQKDSPSHSSLSTEVLTSESKTGEASLPLPQTDLPLPHEDLPLPEKELPPPHEMLLRAPNFWEKHNPTKWVLIVIALLLIIIPVGYVIMNQETLTQNDLGTNNSVVPTESPSPTPTDITASWGTYTDPDQRYTIRFPTERSPEPGGDQNSVWFYEPGTDITDEVSLLDAKALGVRIRAIPFSETPQGNVHEQGVDFITGWREITIDGVKGVYYETHECAPGCLNFVALPYMDGVQTLELFMTSDEDPELFEAFVSSFRFPKEEAVPSGTETVPPDSQVMCPMDAKICPNGISVGRTGPNCEFPACPQ